LSSKKSLSYDTKSIDINYEDYILSDFDS